jgi:hypothetical protein
MARFVGEASLSNAIKDLNKTKVSRHLQALLRSSSLLPARGELAVMALLAWAVDNHYQDAFLGQLELASLASSARRSPRAVYAALADDRMLDADSLSLAAEVLASRLSDLFDDRSLPPQAARR